jgi:Ca2+-transporting ATPase
VDWIALNAAVNSTANLEEKQGKFQVVGNSTEGALLHWVREAGLDYDALRERFEPVYQMHFSGERKRMTTVIRYGKRLVALVKGAPELVLERSTHFARAEGGEPQPWTPETHRTVLDGIRDSASQAMRTLAFGYTVLPPDTPTDEDELHARRESLEMGLVFVGFVAIRDPLRPDVKDAITECRRAGIEVKMITGDNVETARHRLDIGLIDRRDAEVNTPDGVVMMSDKFNELSDDECAPAEAAVLARAGRWTSSAWSSCCKS